MHLVGQGRTVDPVEPPHRAGRLWARVRDIRPGLVDLFIGVAFLVVGFASTTSLDTGDPGNPYERRDLTALILIVACAAPFFVRRRWPLPVFFVSATAVALLSALGYSEGVLPMFALVGAYTVGAHRPAREAVIAAAWMAVVLVGLYFSDSRGFDEGELAFNTVLFGTAILIGWNVQSRRLRLRALEAGHAAAAAQAAADERLRIAQELHDVVAHSLGVIAVQSGVGLHVLRTDPDEAERALEHISQTSRSSLTEIRRLLGAIREDGHPGYQPAPTLAELPALLRDLELAGLDVHFDVDGDLERLPAGMELAAYRIVQEATTNTLRHADARHLSVQLRTDDGAFLIDVVDDGHGSSSLDGAAGHGLVGMRERVALYGGTVHAGPAPAGGFRVSARLPLDSEPVA
jgi:signal transduction histidine kinase